MFPDPDTLDINRKPNRHYAFGSGAHRCLGANLARVELQVLIQEVLRRLPDYEVVPAEVVRYPGLNRGMSGLGARFTPGSREEAEQ
jgi:cytochrome P450